MCASIIKSDFSVTFLCFYSRRENKDTSHVYLNFWVFCRFWLRRRSVLFGFWHFKRVLLTGSTFPFFLFSFLPYPTCFPFLSRFIYLTQKLLFLKFFSAPLADLLFYLCARLSPACLWRNPGGNRTFVGPRQWAWWEGSAKDGVNLTESSVWTGRRRCWQEERLLHRLHPRTPHCVMNFNISKKEKVVW